MVMAPKQRRTRATRNPEMTDAEYEALKNVTSDFRAAQITFDRRDIFKATHMLTGTVLKSQNLALNSAQFLVLELANTISRVTNGLSECAKSDPEYFNLCDLEKYSLCTEVLWAKALNPRAYPYDDIFASRHAPYITGGGSGGGLLRAGFDDRDVDIRALRLRALVEERGPENNMTRDEMKELQSRLYPTIDRDDPRFWNFCCEKQRAVNQF